MGAAFRDLGIDIRLGVTAESVDRAGAIVKVELSDGQGVEAEEILVAVGRRALTDDLGLETVGLKPGETIKVDDTLRVPGRPWLFAVGDVNGRSLLTHMRTYQARVAAQVIVGREARATRDDHGAPRVIFTDPQVAAVGLTFQGAQDSGINARAYDVATSDTAGASFHGRNTPGTSRLVVDEDRSIIVGATFTGTEVAEWLQAATIALVGEIPLALLREPSRPSRHAAKSGCACSNGGAHRHAPGRGLPANDSDVNLVAGEPAPTRETCPRLSEQPERSLRGSCRRCARRHDLKLESPIDYAERTGELECCAHDDCLSTFLAGVGWRVRLSSGTIRRPV